MNHHTYMKWAIDLAKSVKGQTSPNPLVGAVIVKDGRIVGMGAHLKAGEAHAEVQALRMAGAEAAGSTIYVTLEPCAHYGKTPPCAQALIDAKVSRVVIADSFDPNPLVAGKGVEMLRNAGIEVITGVEQEAAAEINEVFKHYITTGTPFVTLKVASTLDGKIAASTGDSQWVTGEEARLDVHRLRHEHDAILVGIGTVLADNPRLTTRLPDGGGRNPIRIVLDSHLRIPLDCHLVTDGQAPTWVVTTNSADTAKQTMLEERGIRVIRTGEHQQTDIRQMLRMLGELQVTSLLVEGGSQVNGQFLRERAFQKIIYYLAPKLLGGSNAFTSFGGAAPEKMSEALELTRVTVEMVGRDMKVTGYPG